MIYILRLTIKDDIKQMPRKILDISLIKEDVNDLTFFNIDEQEVNDTLKALKKTYITTNSKEETILKLKNKANHNTKNSKQLKLESYKKYNEALNMIDRNFINSAIEMIEEALELNPKDIDILNLKGLIKFLKCDFDQSFESFYKSLCYGNNDLSKKYVNILSSEEFSTFLSRYNHAIRFINKDLNQESIQIFENITNEECELIEPYLLLYLIYEKLGNEKKSNYYYEKLKLIDKDNSMFEDIIKVENKIDNVDKDKKSKMKYIYISSVLVLIIGFGLLYSQNKKEVDKLNSKINETQDKINQTSDELNKANNQLDKANSELDEIKNKEENAKTKTEVIVADEEALFSKASKLKSSGNDEEALKYFKLAIENGKTKKYLSESIYQVASVNEKLKNYDEAIKYYRKYINTYDKKDNYYDDCFYNIAMIYYNKGELENAKKELYSLRSEVPNSMYNNSKVESILKEK